MAKCNRCGAINGAYGVKDKFNGWHTPAQISEMSPATYEKSFGSLTARVVPERVVLSGRGICQWCDTSWGAKLDRARQHAAGQLDMFEGD